MQSKYELSLSKDYVADWTLQDALRELTQNALDQSTLSEKNSYTITYNEQDKKLLISNKASVLETKSLLLGATTKATNKQLIGQFGEGYKIALLVLTRLCKAVVIYNYGKREVWTVRFVNSRRYDTEVLTVFVEKDFPWSNVPNNDLTIEVNDISEDDYKEYVERTLQLQVLNENNEYLNTQQGRILLNDRHRGKLFVNGLFINNIDVKYGYDIKPEFLTLGRDRNLVDSFDLAQVTSTMWLQHNGERLKQLILDHANDVEYLHKTWALKPTTFIGSSSHEKLKEVATDVYDILVKDNPEDNIIFVSTQKELNTIQEEYEQVTPVIVSEQIKELVENVPEYREQKKSYSKRTLSQYQQYIKWKRDNLNTYLYSKSLEELDKIVNIKED